MKTEQQKENGDASTGGFQCEGKYGLKVGLRGRGYIGTVCFDTAKEARDEKKLREDKFGNVLGFYYLVVDYTHLDPDVNINPTK